MQPAVKRGSRFVRENAHNQDLYSHARVKQCVRSGESVRVTCGGVLVSDASALQTRAPQHETATLTDVIGVIVLCLISSKMLAVTAEY